MPDGVFSPTILVIDDDEGLLHLIAATLKRENWTVATAVSGAAGLEWLGKNRADLLLLDLKLHDIEGKELIGALADTGRSIPFVIVTGQGGERVAVDMMKRGALDYLVKDINFVEFIPAVVRRALAQIEQRKRLQAAEQSLRESEARMKLAQQAGRVGIFDTDVLKNKSVWTAEQEAIYGLAPGSFEGTQEAWAARVHPDDLPQVQEGLARCVRERRHQSEMDFRIVRPGGEIRWVTNRGVMTYDASGRLVRIIGTSLDITERKEAEASLKESEERFATFMANTPAAAYLKDEAGRYVYFNHYLADLMGRSLEEMRGKTDEDWAPSPVAQQFRANDLEVLATGKSLQRIEVVPLANRTTFWLACKFPLSDAQGRRFVGGVSVDVTATKRLEEEMVAVAEREQQRIGHDLHDGLGQELTALEMKCFLLTEDLAANDFATRRKHFQEQTRRISEALRECITLTRSLARGLAPVNLKAEGLMDALSGLTDRTRVPGKIECSFNCPVPVTLENAQTAKHLYRIAQEAVNNALKHARTRRIRVKLSQSNGTLQLQIKDDGQGLPKIRQANEGMGLEVMRHRAHVIGASLDIDSKLGKGVTVTCTLPLDKHDR